MTGINRNIVVKANKLLSLFPCLIIYGARQVGKTTLSKQLRPTWSYFDLENTNNYNLITNDMEFFFKQHPGNIIFDEAQMCPALFKNLRGVIDNDRMSSGRFIITCSSSPNLSDAVVESLTGRVATITLGTLKTNEYFAENSSSIYSILFDYVLDKEKLHACKRISTLQQIEHLWLYGGYPEPLIKKTLDPNFANHWFNFYYDNYINRDVKQLFPKLNTDAYSRFVKMLAALSGTILNKRDLARNLECGEATIKKYLDIAEGTFLWRMLPSFEKKITKSVIKMPKGYMRDTGLVNNLLNLDFKRQNIYALPNVGTSFETFVIEEVIKGLEASDIMNWDVSYYRTRNGAEIDLIISGPFGVVPIEIKSGMSFNHRSIANLKNFIEEHQLPFGIVINQADKIEWLAEKVVQIPITYF